MAWADYGSYMIQVERHDLRLPHWDANGFKVAILSDVHVNHVDAYKRAREAVRLAIAEKPDMLVVIGDFVNFSRQYALDHIRWTFEDLNGVSFPCLAVMGNHDYWTEDPSKIIRTIQNTELRLLMNENFEYQGVSVAGIDDAIARRHSYEFFPEDRVSRSLITLLHEPDFVRDMPTHVSLQLSGHSHGGQICLPFGIPLHTPFGAKRYKAGFYEDARVPLYVTRGVGTIGPDIRLFCRPEVSVLTLRVA
jgi:predicted MPP superfamily phosphohydrolase